MTFFFYLLTSALISTFIIAVMDTNYRDDVPVSVFSQECYFTI